MILTHFDPQLQVPGHDADTAVSAGEVVDGDAAALVRVREALKLQMRNGFAIRSSWNS